ncbi:class I SAM-dependent methyltransferase [Hyperthermus butylicus]|uniref:Methyltransferase n=1 Tax=Hyperthermus butylicus (strain DSM 5456 / JCM 9403 / PLM1-5) TaxID=415426 RepID=A2BKR4_HYPBU|nr:methyltransferase [Hyperthermus butylicus]ABM80574.1 Methyltransferase [Hyperthermus butylicus DSM 5456]
MATLRSNPGPPGNCTLLVTEPRCGETVRAELKKHGLRAKNLRPTSPPARARLPAFPVADTGSARMLREELLSACRGLAELIEAECLHVERVEPPVSYVLVGPVAIVSLDERVRGREREVAEQLLRIPGVRAVYGKEATEGEYRVQRLVHLAGERLEEVVYREHGLEIPIPLGRVYINPRLATEHMRVAEMTAADDTVLDMFAGWGGFPLVISKLGRARLVVANDANPWAIATLARALERNRGKLKTPIIPVMADAALLPELLRPVFTRIIMNLPHSSKQYLPAALKLCSPRGCTIHLYTVASSPEEAAEGITVGEVARIVKVLDYAPYKYIYRVDLKLEGREKNPSTIG